MVVNFLREENCHHSPITHKPANGSIILPFSLINQPPVTGFFCCSCCAALFDTVSNAGSSSCRNRTVMMAMTRLITIPSLGRSCLQASPFTQFHTLTSVRAGFKLCFCPSSLFNAGEEDSLPNVPTFWFVYFF